MFDFAPLIEKHLPVWVEIRRALHRIPEPDFVEFKTAALIRRRLDELGIAHTDGVTDAPTATLGLIGDTAKPCIGLRADIDALPIYERSGAAYASEHAGFMHACGHDGHATALLAAAQLLKAAESQLPVCVKLIFQPAEERGGGAEKVVKAGALDGRLGPKVEAIFGLHNWPALRVGLVAAKPGALMAATDNFQVTMIGKGCHGAFPHLGHDPIVAACDAVVNMQQFVSRELDPTEPGLVTVGQINGGSAVNVIPDSATFSGTVRTLSSAARALARQSLERRCTAAATACGCSCRFEWSEGYPVTENDPKMTDYVAATARRVFGPDRYVPVGRPSLGGEDFAFYLQCVPGCFFLVGIAPENGSPCPPLHNEQYDFNDAALPMAARLLAEVAAGFGDA